MKLNYKRTICVGFAFFLICSFWQAYDTIIPKILTDRFGMSQAMSGIVMAADNILALFLLPLFGVLSDKTKTKLGKRTPFILVGTILAVSAVLCLSFVDNAQLSKLDAISDIDSAETKTVLYEYEYDRTITASTGEEFILSEKFTADEFMEAVFIDENGKATELYTTYVVPARNAYIAQEITQKDPSSLILFLSVLLVLLLSMATFRTPAVALMPDVTPSPLRSKANAVINLMGTIGGSLVLGLGMIFATGSVNNTYMRYTGYFCAVAGVMIVCLTIFMLTVREKKFVAEMEEFSRQNGLSTAEEDEDEKRSGSRKLTSSERISLILLLASVVLWFFGYNAVTSKYSVYAVNVLDKDYNTTLLIAQAAAVVAYIPVGIVASKLGRKKTILAGIIMLTTAFTGAIFIDSSSPSWLISVLFALAGVAWATINVNSFPMVVELAKGSNTGKYTGYYYTASMSAQIVTPILSGYLMTGLGTMKILFPYAAIFVALSFVTMLFVKHGDSRPEQVKDKMELLAGADD